MELEGSEPEAVSFELAQLILSRILLFLSAAGGEFVTDPANTFHPFPRAAKLLGPSYGAWRAGSMTKPKLPRL